jgi:hypothetical protein
MLAIPLAYFAIQYDWPAIRDVQVTGNSRLSQSEIIGLASLNDPLNTWAIFQPRYAIKRALESNPLIARAEVSLSGPLSLGIKVSEREPIAAIEANNHYLTFDRTGELMEIYGPRDTYTGRVVRGIPPGILKVHGTPMYTMSDIWKLTPVFSNSPVNPETITPESQFGKIVNLLNYLSTYAREYDNVLDSVSMNQAGEIVVNYKDLPPIAFGNMDEPDTQFRCLIAVLQDKKDFDPAVVTDIDLSNIQFPVFHKKEGNYTQSEHKAIMVWKKAAESVDKAKADSVAKPEVNPKDSSVQTSTSDGESTVHKKIFSLSGGR